MEWFKNVFLNSFERNKEINISEKQFGIFERYLKNTKETGYLYTVYGTVENIKIEAYEWACVGKHRYYAKITEL